MSRFDLTELWEHFFPNKTEAYDYAGRKMVKAAIGNQNSRYCPTVEHIRPISRGGKDSLKNIVVCNQKTNAEKGDKFPSWKANGKIFQAKRVKGTSDEYEIYQLD